MPIITVGGGASAAGSAFGQGVAEGVLPGFRLKEAAKRRELLEEAAAQNQEQIDYQRSRDEADRAAFADMARVEMGQGVGDPGGVPGAAGPMMPTPMDEGYAAVLERAAQSGASPQMLGLLAQEVQESRFELQEQAGRQALAMEMQEGAAKFPMAAENLAAVQAMLQDPSVPSKVAWQAYQKTIQDSVQQQVVLQERALREESLSTRIGEVMQPGGPWSGDPLLQQEILGVLVREYAQVAGGGDIYNRLYPAPQQAGAQMQGGGWGPAGEAELARMDQAGAEPSVMEQMRQKAGAAAGLGGPTKEELTEDQPVHLGTLPSPKRRAALNKLLTDAGPPPTNEEERPARAIEQLEAYGYVPTRESVAMMLAVWELPEDQRRRAIRNLTAGSIGELVAYVGLYPTTKMLEMLRGLARGDKTKQAELKEAAKKLTFEGAQRMGRGDAGDVYRDPMAWGAGPQ